jgi:hypothetical protein
MAAWLHKVKKKWSRYTPWRRMGWEEENLLLILILGTGLGWVVSITPRPCFTPGERTPVPIEQKAGWAPEPVWTQGLEERSSAPVGDRTPIVQPVVRHYTAWATAAHPRYTIKIKIKSEKFGLSYHWNKSYQYKLWIYTRIGSCIHCTSIDWQHSLNINWRSEVRSHTLVWLPCLRFH